MDDGGLQYYQQLGQQEEMMNNIAKAFCKAQKEFAPALKTNTNPHFKSKYVGLDGCIEAVIDALNNNGIALMQAPIDCESGVKIETIFLHESGEQLSGGILHLPASKQDAQGYGSALTYARRYGLMAACGIAPEDDDGNHAVKTASKSVSNITMTESVSPEIIDKMKPVAAEIEDFIFNNKNDDAFVVYDNVQQGDERVAVWGLLQYETKQIIKRLGKKVA